MIPVQVGVGAGRQREGGATNKKEGILIHHHNGPSHTSPGLPYFYHIV